MNKDIIRIAEAMGYDDSPPVTVCDPSGDERQWNPLTSHDDCHALIEWLNGRGYQVLRNDHWSGKHGVSIYNTTNGGDFCEHWYGPDTRIGVVELTLKILDESDE